MTTLQMEKEKKINNSVITSNKRYQSIIEFDTEEQEQDYYAKIIQEYREKIPYRLRLQKRAKKQSFYKQFISTSV
jgi:hypothetical protein